MKLLKIPQRTIVKVAIIILVISSILITITTAGLISINQPNASTAKLSGAITPSLRANLATLLNPYDFLISKNTTNDQYYAQSANGTICFTSNDVAAVINPCFNAPNIYVLLSSGNFEEFSTIWMNYTGDSLAGQGSSSTIVLAPYANCNMITLYGSGGFSGDGYAMQRTVSNLCLSGNNGVNTLGSGIYVIPSSLTATQDTQDRFSNLYIDWMPMDGICINDTSTNIRVENLNDIYVLNTLNGYGLNIGGSDHILSNIQVGQTNHAGIHVYGGGSVQITNCKTYSCGRASETMKDSGFYFSNTGFLYATNCMAQGNYLSGFCFENIWNSIFSNLQSEDNGQFLPSSGFIIGSYVTNCQFSNCQSFNDVGSITQNVGFRIEGKSQNNQFTNCRATAMSKDGFQIYNSSSNNIQACFSSDCGGIGFNLSGASKQNQIGGCFTQTNNASLEIDSTSTNNIVTNNNFVEGTVINSGGATNLIHNNVFAATWTP